MSFKLSIAMETKIERSLIRGAVDIAFCMNANNYDMAQQSSLILG